MKPKIENAPGLTWKPRKDGWEARWQCRSDIAARGFEIKTQRIWEGAWPDAAAERLISSRCQQLQDEMLAWSRRQKDGTLQAVALDGTVAALVDAFKTDPDSPFHEKRFATRQHYDTLARILRDELGDRLLEDLTGRDILHWHRKRFAAGKVTMAHGMIGMFRMLVGYGVALQGDEQCLRLKGILSSMRFPMAKPRSSRLTAEQAQELIAKAHEEGFHSIALAQAFQFECMFRQKDVIGEWVPETEPGETEIRYSGHKWLRGLRWEEIDENLVLTHVTSKRGKPITIDLKQAPMVLAELRRLDIIPKRGPVIISEQQKRPYGSQWFRTKWRRLATKAGIPKNVRNMDTRSGAISEGVAAGAKLEHLRHAATHSDLSTTQNYDRSGVESIANVQRLRVEHRNKTGTKNGN